MASKPINLRRLVFEITQKTANETLHRTFGGFLLHNHFFCCKLLQRKARNLPGRFRAFLLCVAEQDTKGKVIQAGRMLM